MDATRLLETDHQKVKGLFELIQQTDDAEEKRTLFQEIKGELQLHSEIEEEVFYPAFERMPEFRERVQRFIEEHQDISDLLDDIDESEEIEEVADQIERLSEEFERHVKDEEEDFFPRIRKVCDQAQLDDLGMKLERAKSRREELAA